MNFIFGELLSLCSKVGVGAKSTVITLSQLFLFGKERIFCDFGEKKSDPLTTDGCLVLIQIYSD